jgi:hypothetical protein
VNIIQALQFELMRKASFNGFDGDVVVDSLITHSDLWTGVVMDRADYYYSAGGERKEGHNEPVDLIKLRDIGAGYWNVDTVYILPADGREDDLLALAKTWGADEIDWYRNTHVGRYLRVWFD